MSLTPRDIGQFPQQQRGLGELDPLPDLRKEQESLLGKFLERRNLLPEDVATAVSRYYQTPSANPAEQLWKDLSKGTFSALEWVGDKIVRFESGLASAAAAAVGDLPHEMFGIDSRAAERLEELNVLEGFMVGLRRDPGAITIGEYFIPDEVGDIEVPLLYKVLGLKTRHLRIVPDVMFSPLTYVGLPGKAPAFLARGTVTRRARLTRAGRRAQAGVQEALERQRTGATRLHSTARRKAIRDVVEAGRQYAGPDGPPLKDVLKDLVAPEKATGIPGRDFETAIRDAFRAQRDMDGHRIARVMDRMVRNDPSLIHRPGLHLNLPGFSIPLYTDKVVAPFQALWTRAPAYVTDTVDELINTTSLLFNEVGSRATKLAPWLPQVETQARAIAHRMRKQGDQYLQARWKGVPKEALKPITDYMYGRRGATQEELARLLERIPEKWRFLTEETAEQLRYMHVSENRMGLGLNLNERADYFPLRTALSPEELRTLRIYEQRRWGADALDNPRVLEGTATFRKKREFDTPADVLAYWKQIGVPWAQKAADDVAKGGNRYILTDPRLILKRRFDEHAKFAGDRYKVGQLEQRIGFRDDPAKQAAWRSLQTTPELARNMLLGKPSQYSIRSHEKIGKLIEVKGGKPAIRKVMKDMGLTDAEKALYIESRVRRIESPEDFARLVDEVGDLIEEIKPSAYNKLLDEIGYTRGGPDHVDFMGRPYQELTDLKVNKELNGLYLPQPIIDHLTKIDQVRTKLPGPLHRALRMYDWMLGRFKVGNTLFWPAFTIRNMYSDFAQAFTEIGVATFNPLLSAQAMKVISGGSGHVKINGKNVPIEYLREVAEDFHIIVDPHEVLETIARDGTPLRVAKKALGVLEPERLGPTIKGRKVTLGGMTAARESVGRMHLFMHYLNQGATMEMAAMRTNRIFIDYGALSEFQRGFINRAFAFPTWNIRNIQITAEQLRAQPGRLSAQIKLGMQDYGPDEAFLPEYATGAMKLGIRHDKDQKVRFITGIDLPVGAALNLTLNQDFGDTFRNWVSQAAPWRAWVDVFGYKRDPFTNRDLTPEARQYLYGVGAVVEHLPKPLRDFFEFRDEIDPKTGTEYKSVNAAKWHIWVKSTMLSRFASTRERFERYMTEEGPDTQAALLDFVGGFRAREYDLSQRQVALIKANIAFLKEEGRKAGIIYDFTLEGISRRNRR